MAQSNHIHFVTWPDGTVDEKSVNIFSERHSIQGFIAAFLPVQWFGPEVSGYVADSLWRCARDRGFKVHTIEFPVE